MPEERIFRCDAPGCDEIGDYVTITIAGITHQVILGPKHRAELQTIAEWGTRTSRPMRRSDERRILSLYRPDRNSPAGDGDAEKPPAQGAPDEG